MIEVWQNKETECPSVQVGSLTMDLGKEDTPAQKVLFALVMNHPDAVAGGAVRAPVNDQIAQALMEVVQDEIGKHLPKPRKKRMPHSVQVSVDRS